ncbi:MAG: hypothetical protein H6959_07805 [Chromatiaceae bacterium]|nr:hypothetical protein [Gammaproteobacteria bacterium]MCP5300739.1 hypothetical protein [Chromatiaceae bacterium]MCP5422811.1 hypothetical protein [Chromatiaceae bacterium]
MITIDSDDAELAALVQRLAELVAAAGGYLDARLRIVIARGDLSVRSDAADGELLVRLPRACLLPIDEVDLALNDDRLQIESLPASMGEVQRDMLECMIAIYNRGAKIASYREELPWLAFADAPELLELLHRGRAQAPKPSRLFELARTGALDTLALEGFMGSRILDYRDAAGAGAMVMMPFIDFFNHHVRAAPFARDGEALTVTAAHPLAGSDECFVRYNALDALDAYLNYGFVDTSAGFVRSVPVRIDLPDVGVIDIQARVAQRRKQLAAGLTDLGALLPRAQRAEDGSLSVSQLVIPGAAPELFHRAVGALVAQFVPAIGPSELRAAVDTVVAEVMTANRAYYGHLDEEAGRLAATPARDRLRQLVEVQSAKLAAIGEGFAREWSWSRAKPAFPYNYGQGLTWS